MKKRTSIYHRHFAFAYVLLVAVIFCGCEPQNQQQKGEPKNNVERDIMADSDFEIVTIDSCEYIVFDRVHGYAGSGGICHKQNCKFCEERSKK